MENEEEFKAKSLYDVAVVTRDHALRYRNGRVQHYQARVQDRMTAMLQAEVAAGKIAKDKKNG